MHRWRFPVSAQAKRTNPIEMFTQILSTKGLRELCPDFSKIAFVLMLFFVGFAAPQVQGQTVISIVDIEGFSSESSMSTTQIEKKHQEKVQVSSFTQLDIFPNPFNTELTIKVSEEEGLNYLELLNENGAVVWENNVYSIPNKFFIESLNPGTYYLKLSLSGGTHTETLVYEP